jgi:hypothetical protein
MKINDPTPEEWDAAYRVVHIGGENTKDPRDVQIGGNHYTSKKIQPIEYIHANGLGYMEGNIIKYITRHPDKNGADDIRKALHYCRLILKYKYGED